MKITIKKQTLAIILLILIAMPLLVYAQISPSLNLNGHNRFSIINYTKIEGVPIISGVENMTIGTGTLYMDIYANATWVVFDTYGYNVAFTENLSATRIDANLSWSKIDNFTSACPSDSYMTAPGNSIICSTINHILNLNVSGNFTLPQDNFQTCGSTETGIVKYNTTSNHPMYCNSTDWVQI